MTSSNPKPAETYEILSNGVDTDGISLKWGSEEACAEGGTNSFTAKVYCDELVTGQGAARIDSIDSSDACNPVVRVSHAAGCPISL